MKLNLVLEIFVEFYLVLEIFVEIYKTTLSSLVSSYVFFIDFTVGVYCYYGYLPIFVTHFILSSSIFLSYAEVEDYSQLLLQ